MPRSNAVQFNVRSAFARDRAHELAKLTGMTATQIVQDALRGYVPPGTGPQSGNLVRKGPILVLSTKGRSISNAEAEEALEAARNRDLDD